ncbi:MAG: hypothetical protein H6868_07650 [Rhodospirillales bacterium]|nr:hypothetical protein [Rhodospirillales bacterium]
MSVQVKGTIESYEFSGGVHVLNVREKWRNHTRAVAIPGDQVKGPDYPHKGGQIEGEYTDAPETGKPQWTKLHFGN